MNRIVIAALLAGCATTSSSSSSSTPDAAKPRADSNQKMAISNVIPFDVAACGPRALSLTPLTADVLTGAMLSMGPATQECFIDLQSRDGQPFDLKAKMTVGEAGIAVEVNGLGASASGKECVKAAFMKLPVVALPAGSKQIVAEIPVGGGSQTVRVGDNAANDIAGTLRLAQPTVCECYAKLGAKPAPTLKADVEVSPDGTSKITLNTTDELGTCIAGKLQAVKLGNAPAKLGWPLLLKNSYATEVEASAPAALRFQQLDGISAQRRSDVIIAAGQRDAAAVAFDDLAKKYKQKPAKGMLEELKTRCADVSSGDDKQMAAVKGLVAVLEDSQKLVVAEKAKDPQWAQVEPMLEKQLTGSNAEVARIEAQKKNDVNACPKTKY